MVTFSAKEFHYIVKILERKKDCYSRYGWTTYLFGKNTGWNSKFFQKTVDCKILIKGENGYSVNEEMIYQTLKNVKICGNIAWLEDLDSFTEERNTVILR